MSYCLYILDDKNCRFPVDIDNRFELSTNYAITDFEDLNKPLSFLAEQVVLRGTKRTNRALSHLYRVDGFNNGGLVNTQYRCVLEYNGVDVFRGAGILTIEEIVIESPSIMNYDCSIVATRYNWVVPLINKNCCQLDLGSHAFSAPVAIDSWDRTGLVGAVHDWQDGYVYVPVHYGLWNGGANNDEVAAGDVRPSVYVKKIVEEMFAQCTDFELESIFFESELFEGLILPFVGDGETWWLSNDQLEQIRTKAVKTSSRVDDFSSLTTSDIYINFDDDTPPNGFDQGDTIPGNPLGNWQDNNKYIVPFDGQYTFYAEVQYLWSATAADTSAEFNFEINNVAQTGFEHQPITMAGTDINGAYIVEFTGCLTEGDVLQVHWTGVGTPQTGNINFLPNSYVSVVPASNSTLCPGALINVGQTLPCTYTCKELLDALTHMFSLVWETDEINKIVRVEPDSIYYDCTVHQDWSNRVNCLSRISQVLSETEDSENVNITYRRDSNDYFLEEYRNTNDEILYTQQLLSQTSTTEEEDFDNPIFAPSVYIRDFHVRGTASASPIWLRLWNKSFNGFDPAKQQLDNSTFDFVPRIAYYKGLEQNIDPSSGVAQSGFVFEGTQYPYFPYAFMVNNLDPQDYSLAFNNGNEGGDVGLVQTFWGDYVELTEKGRALTFEMIFSKEDIKELNFGRSVYVSHPVLGTGVYRLGSVENWNPKTLKATVILFLIP